MRRRRFAAQQATASYFFKSQQYDLAVKSLHSLLERSSLEPTQRINLTAQLVLAAAHTDKAEAIRLGAQLPEVGIVEDVDMGELEDMLRRRDFLKHSSTAPGSGCAVAAHDARWRWRRSLLWRAWSITCGSWWD